MRLRFFIAALALATRAFAYVKIGNILYTDGSGGDAVAACAAADPGDIVDLPSGSYNWGAGGGVVTMNPSITLRGQGAGVTTITMANDGVQFASGLVNISTGSVVKDFTANSSTANPCTFFKGTGEGWRITGITYVDTKTGSDVGYFAYISSTTGLIDHCTITANSGQCELIVARGPLTAWQNPNTMGTSSAVYIEQNTFNTNGYVCDFNANGQGVVRFNTINGTQKVDGHGLATDVSIGGLNNRGVRQMEVYYNTWNSASSGWPTIELRGGTGMVFYNTCPNTTTGRLLLEDYGYQGGPYSNFSYIFQTPANYPLGDQIGTGQDVTINATSITTGMMVIIASVGSGPATDYTIIGAPSNTVGVRFVALGVPTGNGTVTHQVAAAEPMYLWGNVQNGAFWPRTVATAANGADLVTDSAGYATSSTSINVVFSAGASLATSNSVTFGSDTHRYLITSGIISASAGSHAITIAAPGLQTAIPAAPTAVVNGALTSYQRQQGNPSATFGDQEVIITNRDVFAEAGFDTNTGTSIGTTAQMNALTPSVTGYGFWVTDQGSWRAGYSGTSGLLYRWSGSAWVLFYTPYTYPHPLQGSNPGGSSGGGKLTLGGKATMG